jgi:1,4-dihydroxy-2-naphthoate octaprenyltransferase
MSTAAVPNHQPSADGVRVWLLAARPATLVAAIVPVLVGGALAARLGSFQPLPFVVALAAALLIQIGCNLANDYFDYHKGADTSARLGPPRVTQSGLVPPATVWRAALLVFALATLLGLYLVWVGGLPILLIGAAAIFAAVLYVGGPWPYGYHGLGDLVCFVFFGLLGVVGMALLLTGGAPPEAWWAALPVAALVTAILVVNNLRDIDTDRAARKYTLAVLLGRSGTRAEYVALLALAYLVPPLWALVGGPRWWWLPWLSLVLAVPTTRLVLTAEGRPLNLALKQTARLHLVYGALWALALLL